MSVVLSSEVDFSSTPEDLRWSLEQFKDKERGMRFLHSLSEYLPVYSPSVRQLYCKYDLTCPAGNIVVLPDTFAFDLTFSRVDREAVKKLSLEIIPSPGGLMMLIPIGGSQRVIPFKTGLRFVRDRLAGLGFLPAIQKGDLREFNKKSPAIHLHCIDRRYAVNLSKFEMDGLAALMTSRVAALELVAESITI